MERRVATPQPSTVAFYVIRAIFVLLFTYTSWKLGVAAAPSEAASSGALVGIIFGVALAVVLVGFEAYFSQHFLSTFYAMIAGLLLGLLISVFFVQIVAYIPKEYIPENEYGRQIKAIIGLLITVFCCYLSVVLVLRAGNNYRLLIPFVELKQEGPQRKRLLVDPSVVIDGRIADIADTLIIDQAVYLPDFVLAEIHKVADSTDAVKRTRGRRGLDMLNRLRANPRLNVEIFATHMHDEGPVEARLIQLAQDLNGRIFTTDNNLHRLAQLQGVEVVNLNELENALRPVLLVGEELTIKIIRPGEEPDQGVGYLEDGTMVVVKGGRNYIGQEVVVTITSLLQRPTGRMIFGQIGAIVSATAGKPGTPPTPEDDERDRRRKAKG